MTNFEIGISREVCESLDFKDDQGVFAPILIEFVKAWYHVIPEEIRSTSRDRRISTYIRFVEMNLKQAVKDEFINLDYSATLHDKYETVNEALNGNVKIYFSW